MGSKGEMAPASRRHAGQTAPQPLWLRLRNVNCRYGPQSDATRGRKRPCASSSNRRLPIGPAHQRAHAGAHPAVDGILLSSSTCSTPTWASPRAPPPERTSAIGGRFDSSASAAASKAGSHKSTSTSRPRNTFALFQGGRLAFADRAVQCGGWQAERARNTPAFPDAGIERALWPLAGSRAWSRRGLGRGWTSLV